MKASLLSSFFIIIFSVSASAASAVQCLSRPEFIGQYKTFKNTEFKHLPQKIFVARSVDYFVEDRLGFQVWSEQSFVNGKSKIKCGNLVDSSSRSYSQYLPTLMDFSKDQKTGQSFWQIHLSFENQKIGMWNKKSRVFGEKKNLTEFFEKTDGDFYFVEKSDSMFDLFWVKETDFQRQIIRIRFDVVSSL